MTGGPVGQRHPYPPAASFDGGELDCGSGLLLLIRRHIDPLEQGELLEIRSREASVESDLPAWCRLTKNELVNVWRDGGQLSFLVAKGALRPPGAAPEPPRLVGRAPAPVTRAVVRPSIPSSLPAPAIAPLSVMGVGSWPRPRWLLRALHEHLEGRAPEADFAACAHDAVRLAVAAQVRAGVDVVTDGEQWRDNYSSFVGALLQNCELVPVTDLLPYVDDPEEFGRELAALDVPAGQVRHPAVFGPLGRGRPLAVHEAELVRTLTDRPVKVSLPGPYLLSRTMWMECISDRAYPSREALAVDVVRVLREELHFLLAAGVALVQLDEPVLTEVVHGTPGRGGRTFMCGALGERLAPAEELDFAAGLLQEVAAGLPAERLALHVCRGNWTPDETAALSGDYRPLVGLLSAAPVGTLSLECCTPRAGALEVLAGLPDHRRVAVGVLNQKAARLETPQEVAARAADAIRLFGAERVLLSPDCGFATFADNPIVDARLAEAKLTSLVRGRDLVREGPPG